MRILFAGTVHVHYHQCYLETGDGLDTGEMGDIFGGQSNGLCGAGVPGGLWLSTGIHTGDAPFVLELHDAPPPVGPEWEEVVEVSLDVDRTARLNDWGSEVVRPLDLEPGSYRVRYCANGLDAGNAADVRSADEPEIDRYLLQFWPAPRAPDAVLRQTSDDAAYHHDYAAGLPPPRAAEVRAAARAHEEANHARLCRMIAAGEVTWPPEDICLSEHLWPPEPGAEPDPGAGAASSVEPDPSGPT